MNFENDLAFGAVSESTLIFGSPLTAAPLPLMFSFTRHPHCSNFCFQPFCLLTIRRHAQTRDIMNSLTAALTIEYGVVWWD